MFMEARLLSGDVPGRRRTDLTAHCFNQKGDDVMRVNVVGIFAGLAVAAFVSITPAAAQQDYRMAVINGSNVPIEVFQYSECSSNDWRADRLGSTEVIRPGASKVFDMYDGIRDCCRDMKAKFGNGVARERMNVNVCQESEWTVR